MQKKQLANASSYNTLGVVTREDPNPALQQANYYPSGVLPNLKVHTSNLLECSAPTSTFFQQQKQCFLQKNISRLKGPCYLTSYQKAGVLSPILYDMEVGQNYLFQETFRPTRSLVKMSSPELSSCKGQMVWMKGKKESVQSNRYRYSKPSLGELLRAYSKNRDLPGFTACRGQDRQREPYYIHGGQLFICTPSMSHDFYHLSFVCYRVHLLGVYYKKLQSCWA